MATTISRSSRLNVLPEPLLLHIISFLPTLETVKASLISRKFRYLWSSLPNLSFSHTHFSLPHSPRASTRLPFAKLVNDFLLNRPSTPHLRKFHLQFQFNDDLYSIPITVWIYRAINCHVTQLDLDFSNGPLQGRLVEGEVNLNLHFGFRLSLLQASAVRDLKLCQSSISDDSMVPHLKIVALRWLHFEFGLLTDDDITVLMDYCVNLECLFIEGCEGLKNVRISSSKLKHLSLDHCRIDTTTESSVEIVAASLIALEIIGFVVNRYILKDLVSLVEAVLILPYPHYTKVIPMVAHVERLHVENHCFRLMEAKEFFPKSTILNNLRHLHMFTGYSKSDLLGLAAFLELTPNLHTMVLVHQYQVDGNGRIIADEVIDEQINFNLPSLRRVALIYPEAEQMNGSYLMNLFKDQEVVVEKV